LPLKPPGPLWLFIKPLGRLRFDDFHHRGDGRFRFQSQDKMDVIGNATDLQKITTLAAHDAADVGIEVLADWRRDDRLAILRTEHNVIEQVGQGAGHRCSCAPLGLATFVS
jgi:hypothetical protein